MAPKPARKAPRSRAQDTTWRPVNLSGVGNDDWQRQADAAAWSAVSGMPPARFLGWLEPIPIPEDLRARLREAGKALAAEPSTVRADKLLRLAHEAVYGKPDPTPPLEAATAPAEGGADDWWSGIAGDAQKPLAPSLAAFAAETHAALVEGEWTEADGGEVPRENKEADTWWE